MGTEREIAVIAFGFALGAVVGSFLNVVIYRLPRADEGLGLSKPRLSFCPACKATIAWYDNIPLLSYFLLLGRCRRCNVPIPLRYFLVELLAASIFALLASRHVGPAGRIDPSGLGLSAIQAALAAALIAVTFIDIDFRIIPDRIDIPGALLAPVLAGLVPALHVGHNDFETLGISLFDPAAQPRAYSVAASLFGILTGGGVIWLTGVLGSAAFRKEAMGFGDVKLLAMIGGYVGWKGALLALFIGSLAGSVVGIVIRLATRDPYIPFGPFLSLGALVMILWYAEVMRFIVEGLPRLVRIG